MRVVTAAQMREADRRCIEEIGIPGVVLMNNAGTAVFREISGGPVGIVCGKGNNGGDGFVVARLTLLCGMATTVILLADPAEIKGDAAIFLKAYLRLGGLLKVATDDSSVLRVMGDLSRCVVLVDAILGTGAKGEVRGLTRTAIEVWPSGITTIAVDLPSGLDADTGEVYGACIRADKTVTFAFAKQGLLAPNAQAYVGQLVVADIGIPDECANTRG